MALTKQNLNINFTQGVDTKTDPFQVQVEQFLVLVNSVFDEGGALKKRNGNVQLPILPNTSSTLLTTFNGDLTAVGTQIQALSQGYSQWINRGELQPIELDVMALLRNNVNQSQSDTAVSQSGLVCTVFTEQNPGQLSIPIYGYIVADVTTGQNVIPPTFIATGVVSFGGPRVFILGNYFIIVFTGIVGGVYHLQYQAISIVNPSNISAIADISIDFVPSTTFAFDGAVFNNSLYLAWNSASGVSMAFLTSHLSVSSAVLVDASHHGTLFSVSSDQVNSTIWVSYYNLGTTTGYSLARDPQLNVILAPTQIIASGTILNLTTLANAGILNIFYEVSNAYSYDSGIPTNFINKRTLTQSGTLSGSTVLKRSVGLASKAFLMNGVIYFLTVYQSPYQSTYFLLSSVGNIIAELAYENAGGYLTFALPSVSVIGNTAQVSYLFKDLIQSVNKNTNVPSGTQVAGVYSQLGINLATFTFDTTQILDAEIGLNLNLTGGFLWAYDGFLAVEQGFFLYPDSIELSGSGSGGNLLASTYFYAVTYEWTDNQGNAFRSAPSIPVSIITTGTTSSVTVHIPTLRLTYKVTNGVKLVVYRWSLAQQSYYQVTSIAMPTMNNPTIDSIDFVDTLSDADILGNNLLYTTGGVLENIGGPSFSSVFLFDDRLFGIKSEDKNLLMYSKQVLEATPVEMSDLLTIYVAPNLGAQGSTGVLRCGAAMDDKAILFKDSAINYIAGTGPNITGTNNQYTEPQFITSTVGCSNQKSIIFQPQGLMFEFASKAGNQIWLLGRDLSTQFIGASVQGLTKNATVESAVNIPGTNQVRFTMSSGIKIMYDYYYGKWGTFENIPAISSTVYQGVEAYLNNLGQVFQETPGVYLDGSNPVQMKFMTAWIKLAGLQGYQRAYYFYLLGKYISPHKIALTIAYDYNPNATQLSLIMPTNFSPAYGLDLTYGSGTPYGGPENLEQWRVALQRQRCQSFQISFQEIYDPFFGIPAGAGLTLSGINCVVGVKKGFVPMRSNQTVG